MDDFDLKFEIMLLTQRDEYRKRYKGLAAQVEALGDDPADGPLWLRIANQRRELKNLHRLVEFLEGNGWGRRADAWEEGYRSGHSCVGADPGCCREPNPYVPDALRSLKSYPYGGVE